MSFSQREPIDVNAAFGCELGSSACSANTALLEQSTSLLLAKSQTLRPYGAAIIRHAVTNPELRELNTLEGSEQAAALAEASFIEPVNHALNDYWQNLPQSADLNMTGLIFERLVSGDGQPPHIDQRITNKSPVPEAGLLAALLVLKGEVDYGFRATRTNVFNPDDRDFFADVNKGRPTRMSYFASPARPGDVVLLMTNTIHLSKARKKDRLTAAYLSRLEAIS